MVHKAAKEYGSQSCQGNMVHKVSKEYERAAKEYGKVT
jgi:hypothetical protein